MDYDYHFLAKYLAINGKITIFAAQKWKKVK